MAKGKNIPTPYRRRVALPFSNLAVTGRAGRRRIIVRAPMGEGTSDQEMSFPIDQVAFIRIGNVEFYRPRREQS